MKYSIATLLFIISSFCAAQYLKPGRWQGNIHYSNQTIPFIFEVGYPSGDKPQIVLINGAERRVIEEVEVKGDSLIIPLTPFDIAIKARFTAMSMEGKYEKYYRNKSFNFSASFGKPRMMKRSTRPSPPVEERWDMTLDPETNNLSKAVALFKQTGQIVSGTIMTKVSDYRYFEGIMDGDSIKLSCFDGAHAFMFLGKKQAGQWSGELIYDDGYSELWTAKPDPEIELENPFELVKVEAGQYKPYYDLLGAGSGPNAIDPSAYEGKVLIIQLFGTWCPNSHDQTKYLVKWYQENKEQDVAILASSFEANYSQEYGLRRIEEYRKANNIEYDMVLGGRLSKTSAAMPFEFMQRIEAFPTLVILDKKGYARYVHSYFNGPATGKYYSEFDKKFRAIVDELLAE